VTTDPWTSIAYTANADGTSTGTESVDTGGSSADVAGRTMIIHGYDGGRIGCSILSNGVDAALAATPFVKYFSYTESLTVGGSVAPMTTVGTTQSFTYALTGVDPACSSGAGSAANSCGIHVHVGTSCTSDAGAHYYTGSVTTDPWTSIAYTANADGTSTGTESVDTGGSSADVAGRTMIIHGYDGGRIACAILGAAYRPQAMPKGSSGLSGGAIAAIVCGSVALVASLGLAAYWLWSREQKPPPPPNVTPSGVVLNTMS